MWALWIAWVWLGSAFAGPAVPRADLEVVPPEWRDSWAPLVARVQSAREVYGSAVAEADAAERSWQARLAALSDADLAVRTAEKALKKTKKDPASSRAIAEALGRAEGVFAEAGRAEAVARGQRAIALAVRDLAAADLEHAEATLEQARAQSVADAGGWIEVARFDEAVRLARLRREEADRAVGVTRARAALWAQGR